MKPIKNYFASIFLVIAMPLTYAQAQNTFHSTGSASIGTAAPDINLLPATDSSANPASAATSWKEVSTDEDMHYNVSRHLNLTFTIPANWETQLVRVDYENESIFSLKTGSGAPAFLFSVTKVTDAQWWEVKDQLKKYTIVENKDGFITFVQKTDLKKMKELPDVQYRQVLGSLDVVVGSIRLK